MLKINMEDAQEFAKFLVAQKITEVFRSFHDARNHYHHHRNRWVDSTGYFLYQAIVRDEKYTPGANSAMLLFSTEAAIPGKWSLHRDGMLRRELDSKVDLVKVLQEVGIDPVELKKIQTVKVKELREVLDRTKPSADAEVTEIVHRLAKKGDLVSFDSDLGKLKVEMTDDGSREGIKYILTIDWKDRLDELLSGIETTLTKNGLEIYHGEIGPQG